MDLVLVCIWECHLYNGESFHLINLVSPPSPPPLLSPRHSCVFLLCSIITPLSASSSSSFSAVAVSNGLLFGSQPPPLPPCSVLSYHTTCIRALSLPVSPNYRTHARTERRGAREVLLLLGGVTIRTLQHTLTRFALFYERGAIFCRFAILFSGCTIIRTQMRRNAVCLHSHYFSLSSPKLSGSDSGSG